MLDQDTVVSIARRYAEAVTKEFTPSAIVLFGSYAGGTPHADSDIDVGVVFDKFSGDWRTTSSRLWSLAYSISWDVEPHLLDRANDRSGFVAHVMKTGHVVYRR